MTLEHGRPLPDDPPPGHVLVVEDNLVNRMVLEQMLQRMDQRVTSCENGLEAVRIVATGDFDVVLMDCELPEMDGIQATRAIRATGSRVPIVALTAEATMENRERCREAGMDGFLEKPLIMSELKRVLWKFIGG